jgi:site-specific recombinase XerD
MEETVERYLQRRQPMWRPATILGKRSTLLGVCRYLRAEYPRLRGWQQLQRDPHILAWLRHSLRFKSTTRIIRIIHLRLFFEDLIAWDWPQAPAPGLLHDEDIPPEPLVLPKPLPPDVDQAVQQALARTHTLPAMGLLLIRHTGLRLGELRTLSVHALERTHADTGSVRVPVGKTHSERIIPLSPAAVSLVEDILAQRGCRKPLPPHLAGYLMVNPFGRHLTQQSYNRNLKDLTAHIPTTERIYPHRLRHCFATEMARAGMPVPALMKILGHQTPKMTMRYVEVAHVDLRHAYDHALQQIRVVSQMEPAGLPVPSSTPAEPPTDDVPQLLAAVVDRLEHLRRDTAHDQRARDLHRFIKRIRRTRDDLKKML